MTGTTTRSVAVHGGPPFPATGRVVDAETGEPIATALVHAAAHTFSVPVDEHGRFRMDLAAPDAFAMVAGAPGYAMCWQPLEDDRKDLEFRLRRETPETVPHPDYPRPDFDRRPGSDGTWTSLNGTWRLRFDPDNCGLRDGWAAGEDYPHLVVVPFSYTSLAGVGEQARASNVDYASQFADRRGIVWYFREFTVPPGFSAERHTLLRFGAVEWHSTVFLDGAQCFRHDGGYSPFEVDLGRLEPGSTHSVAVRAVVPDNSDRTPYPQGKQTSWYTDTGGIWQPVWLEQADPVRVRDLRVTPELQFEGTDVVSARVSVDAGAEHADGAELKLVIRAQDAPPGPARAGEPAGFPAPREPVVGEVVAEQSVRLDGDRASVTIPVPQPRLWEPEQPWLYRLEAVLQVPGGRDEVHTWFGLRSITRQWAPGHAPSEQDDPAEQYQYLMLNNRPLYLRSVLDQGFNPWAGYSYTGLYQGARASGGASADASGNDATGDSISAPGKGSVLFDLALSKQLGFNSARMHIKVNDPLYYHWADVLGVLVFYDLPNFGYRGHSPAAERLFESVLRDAAHRDYNHPSIVIWDVINEAWGVGGGIAELRLTEHTKPWIERMMALSRRLLGDTRLLVDNSPCCNNYHPSEDTDLLDFHGYYSTWEEWVEVVDDYVHNTHPGSTHNMEKDRIQHGQPLVNSEYGPWSGGAEMDQEVATPFRYTTEVFRSRSKMAGYLFTELTDVEWEWNGWASYDRTLEVPGYLDSDGRQGGVPQANADDVLLVDGRPARRVHPGERITLPVLGSLFSVPPKSDAELTLRWRAGGADNTAAPLPAGDWQQRPVRPDWHTVSSLGEVALTVPDRLAVGHVDLELLRDNEVIATGRTALLGTSGVPERAIELDPVRARRSWPMGSALFDTGSAAAALGYGDGTFHWELPVPRELGEYTRVQLLAEVSAQRPDLPRTRFPQTSERRYPTTLTVTVDGVGEHEVRLPDAPADARGVFSHDAGFDPGRYGYRVLLDFDADLVRAAAADGPLRVSLAGRGGGLALFGAGTGRYGIAPRLVFGTEPLPGPRITGAEPFPSTREGAGVNTYLVPGRPERGTAGRMILNVVNDSPEHVSEVRPVLDVRGGWTVEPDVETLAMSLAPGESRALGFTVHPHDSGIAEVRTIAYYTDSRGRQVSRRLWVLPIANR